MLYKHEINQISKLFNLLLDPNLPSCLVALMFELLRSLYFIFFSQSTSPFPQLPFYFSPSKFVLYLLETLIQESFPTQGVIKKSIEVSCNNLWTDSRQVI